ncbi:MAG: FAD-binding oxidoreductase [Methanobacteriota archaeon]
MDEKMVVELKGRVRGDVILPRDAGYDEARRVYNARIDRRPAAVVRCAGVADVIAAVKAARAADLAVAVRGGGHSVPGFGTADDAVVVDLGRLKGIRVDPAAKTVRAEGGSTWGDFNHATHAFGLATTGGIISTTGIAGLTLGGGIGYLTRGLGLSLDNLVSADVVLADGSFVTASPEDRPDLFWALRGGGGNFGVVTNFEYRLQPIRNIVAGPMFFEVDDAPAILRAFDTYISKAPRELGAFFAWQIAPPLPFIPEDRHGDTLCVLVACWTGRPEDANRAIAPLREAAPVVAEAVGPMAYPAINGAFDGLVPPGLQHYWKAVFAKGLPDDAIAVHAEHGPKVPVVNSTMHIYPINGAVHDVAPEATAFGHRDAKYAMVIAGMWPDPSQNEANTRGVKDYYKDLAPHAEEGGYINFAAGDDANRVAANFGRNYGRLREVKAKYDPGNTFRHNQNIVPAA